MIWYLVVNYQETFHEEHTQLIRDKEKEYIATVIQYQLVIFELFKKN